VLHFLDCSGKCFGDRIGTQGGIKCKEGGRFIEIYR